jgi:hypothetical protein
MTENFNVIKNVNESFSVSLPSQFNENTPPDGTIYAYPKFSNSLEITTAMPDIIMDSLNTLIFTSPSLEITPTTLLIGANQYIYSTTANDCNIVVGSGSSFNKTRSKLYFGKYSASKSWKGWIPFIITDSALGTGTTIASAILYIVSTKTKGGGHVKLKFGCDNRSNALAPTNYNDLNSRTITANFTLENPIGQLTDNVVFACDITTAVQEIINMSDWTYGDGSDPDTSDGKLAILIMDHGSTTGSGGGGDGGGGGTGTGTDTSSTSGQAEFASFENISHDLLFSVTGMSYDGSIVTLKCSTFFVSGTKITVSGVNSGYGVTNIDGDWTCGAGTNRDNVVFTVSSPPTGITPQTTSHGTVSITPIIPTVMSYATKTVTLTANNDFNIGTRIKVAGINSGYTVTNIDGDWVCKTGTNATHVVFDVTSNPTGSTPQTASHGTIVRSGSPWLVISL